MRRRPKLPAHATHMSVGRVRATYEFIEAQRGALDVQMRRRVLDVAPSGYYAWRKHPLSNRARERARLLRLIRASFTANQGIYGAPRDNAIRHLPVPPPAKFTTTLDIIGDSAGGWGSGFPARPRGHQRNPRGQKLVGFHVVLRRRSRRKSAALHPRASQTYKLLIIKGQIWRRGWDSNPAGPLDSVSCRFHNATVAVDASDAVAPCTWLHHGTVVPHKPRRPCFG